MCAAEIRLQHHAFTSLPHTDAIVFLRSTTYVGGVSSATRAPTPPRRDGMFPATNQRRDVSDCELFHGLSTNGRRETSQTPTFSRTPDQWEARRLRRRSFPRHPSPQEKCNIRNARALETASGLGDWVMVPEIESSGLVGLAEIGFEVPEIDSSGLVGLAVIEFEVPEMDSTRLVDLAVLGSSLVSSTWRPTLFT